LKIDVGLPNSFFSALIRQPNNLGIFVVTACERAPDGKLRDETR
jgi:hypothetical protein